MSPIAWVLVSIVHTFSWGNHQSAAELVFDSRAAMLNVWTADGGREDQMPGVDFEKEMVLAVFAGPKNGSGYKIKIQQVIKAEKGNQVIALYQTTEPEGNPVGTKTTYPNHVVSIQKIENANVKFLDLESDEGKKFIAALQAQQAAAKEGQPQPGDGKASALSARAAEMMKAAENGDAKAQFGIGELYLAGAEGLKTDPVEGLKWLKKAAEKSGEFEYLLGVTYLKGAGIPADSKAARDCFERAGPKGSVEAYRVLGAMYQGQYGIQKDAIKSAGYFTRAAEKNDANSEYLLAQLYLQGDGVDKSVDEAYKWMKKSADQGFKPAVEDLPKVEALRK
jgi:TPR repeat protein